MKTVNRLEKRFVKQIGDMAIIANFSLNDDCHNGHEDFSITGETRVKGKIETCGCIHEEIAKYFPELKKFISLHLCNYDGTPMYAIANGFYFLKEGMFATLQETFRCTEDEIEILKKAADETYFKYLINELHLPVRWKNEADEAVKFLEEQTDQKFESKATRKYPIELDAAELKEFKTLLNTYYSPKSIADRLKKDKEDKRKKAIKEIQKTFENKLIELKKDKALNLLIIKNNLPENLIYYSHDNSIKFNWLDYKPTISEEQKTRIKEILALSKYFKDVKYRN